jgi:hypothetical protein
VTPAEAERVVALVEELDAAVALAVEIPAVRAAVEGDVVVARELLAEARDVVADPDAWRSAHLRPIDPA